MSAGALHRGDVVIVNFTPTVPAARIRPAVVVQNDRDNARMQNTVVVQISTTLDVFGRPSLSKTLVQAIHGRRAPGFPVAERQGYFPRPRHSHAHRFASIRVIRGHADSAPASSLGYMCGVTTW